MACNRERGPHTNEDPDASLHGNTPGEDRHRLLHPRCHEPGWWCMSLRKPIYAHSLSLTSSPVERYPVAVTLFLVGILIVIALLILGVVRNFRWLFWLLLIATALSALPIPITLLQMTGVLPTADPLWYGLFRMGGAAFEFALAVWMIHIYRHEGVWGLGKQRNEREDTQPYETGRGWSVSMTEKPGKSTIEAPSSSCGEHDAQTQARPQGDTL